MKQKKVKYIGLFILLVVVFSILLAFYDKNESKEESQQKVELQQNEEAEQEPTVAEETAAEQESEEVDSTQTSEEGQPQEISLGENLVVTSMESYSGSFVEDGSDEEVDDTLMITVKNNGDKTVQYAEAQLVFEDETAEFAFSTLRPGEAVIVLEKNRLRYSVQKEVKESALANVVFFENSLDFCEDKFKISAMDGVFNVENISGEDLSGNVIIYYKNKRDGIYFGGITYRTTIEGGIEKDGIKQTMTKHFTLDGSEVMFVEYREME